MGKVLLKIIDYYKKNNNNPLWPTSTQQKVVHPKWSPIWSLPLASPDPTQWKRLWGFSFQHLTANFQLTCWALALLCWREGDDMAVSTCLIILLSDWNTNNDPKNTKPHRKCLPLSLVLGLWVFLQQNTFSQHFRFSSKSPRICHRKDHQNLTMQTPKPSPIMCIGYLRGL